jgi:cellulose synthase/poly-beta-1,6-N-acetylglucosamine synthase-like glycosyltransferase
MSAEVPLLAAYVMGLVVLLVFSVGQLHLVLLRRRAAPPRADAAEQAGDWPAVTVQLPVYNERHVVERLLRAIATIDYPRDRLRVQVLDDSDDVTTAIVARVAVELRRDGLTVDHIRRADRAGYKAGALAHALRSSTDELVAVFDADFVPQPDVLKRLVPCFVDPNVGAVQARWEHLNIAESLLTRVEAFLLDLHFGLEQPARSVAGLFLNFNGSAGIWRRAAIDDAGGWSDRTVTEDVDLSYRAQRRHWRVVYVESCAVPAELPSDMTGLRGQQHRWIKGGAQNARLHAHVLVRCRDLPARVRWHALQHLLAGTTYVVILGVVLLSVPLAALKGTTIDVEYVDYGAPFALATVALVAAFYAAQRPTGGRAHLRFAGMMAAFMVFTLGLAVHNGSAALEGWFGRRGGEFVRTPKSGASAMGRSVYVATRVDRRVLREIVVMAILLAGLAIGWRRQDLTFAPLQLMALAGLTWVVGLSLWHPLRARSRSTERRHGPRPSMSEEVAR